MSTVMTQAATPPMTGRPACAQTPQRRGHGRALLAAGTALCAFASTALWQRGGYDLLLYQRMAARALAGGNPYADPYADFPPLKMLLFAGLERAHAWFGFSALVAAAVAGLGALLLLRARPGRAWGGPAALQAGLCVLALPPLFLRAWVQPWEDKGVYVVLLLALLLVVPDCWRGGCAPQGRGRLLGAGVLVGLVQGYGGAGLILLPFVLAWPLARRPRDWRGAALLAVAALGVVALAHVPFWPHWVAGYTRRAARQQLLVPAHVSFWLLWLRAGLPAAPWLPTLATAALATAAGVLFGLRRLGLHGALALGASALLLWGPEASFDRLLAATLPLVLLLAQGGGRTPWARILVLALALALAAIGAGVPGEPRAGPLLLALWAPPLVALVALAALAALAAPRAGAGGRARGGALIPAGARRLCCTSRRR